MKDILNLALRRGFLFPSAEIYGGVAGFWDYGPLGTLLKRKFENCWRNFFLNLSENFYEIDTTHIMPEPVFVASGHLESFNDPLVECKSCNVRIKADLLLEENKIYAEGLRVSEIDEKIKKNNIVCPKCGGKLGNVRLFNMMFKLNIGSTKKEIGYLRPETAQGSFLAFKRMFGVLRNQLPLGLAIIGRAYRNEISPRQGFYRLREFNQAELQIFFSPDKLENHAKWDEVKNKKLYIFSLKNRERGRVEEKKCSEIELPKFYLYHLAKTQEFYLEVLKIPPNLFRFRELSEKERAFYNKIHWDVEVYVETLGGFKEMGGIHYRTNHDLSGHKKISKKEMEVYHEGKKIIPHVLELSFGVDRNFWMLLDVFFERERERTVLRFPKNISPFDVAVFPLVKKDLLPEVAQKIYKTLKKSFKVYYDEKGSIGRRYRRQDEIGTPFCITVDYQSLEDKKVTIRERDSMKQERVEISKLEKFLRNL